MAKDIIKIEFKPVGDGVLINAIEKLDDATKSLVKAQASLVKEGNKNRNTNKTSANAVEKLEIKLRALNSSFTKAKISTNLQTKALEGDRVALEKLRLATNKYIKTATKASASTRILGGTFAVLRSKMLLFNFAMGLGIRQLARFGGASAKVDSMSRAFNTLSGNTQILSGGLNKLKSATNNTMSEFDLFQQANNAMILGVTRNSDEMAEMFDVAQRLGRALGRDTASSVESLITGIGRQSRLMLDNIGIIVKSDEAYTKYAEKLKTTSDKLTDAQKKQAFLEATMKSAREKVKALGKETLTVQDSYDQLATASSNLATATGNFLQPAISFLAKSFSSVAKDATSFLNTLANANKTIGENTSLLEQESIVMAKINVHRRLLAKLNDGDEIYFDIIQKSKKENIKLDKQLNEIRAKMVELQFGTIKAQKEESALTEKQKKEQQTQADQETFLEGIKKQRILERKAIFESSEKTKKTILEQSTLFQINQIKLLEENYLTFNKSTLESETYFAEQRKAIYDKEKEERFANEIEIASKIKQGFDFVTSEYRKNVERRRDNEIQALQDSLAYEQATAEERKTMEKNVKKEFAKEEKRLFMMKKMSTVAQIVLDTASAMTEALPNVPLSLAIGALGTIQQGIALATPPPKYEQGGLVGGRRHSQGGTMIEAERGEFVMSRSAVESIGTETLNQMNQGGAGGITLNISAPLVDETIIDTIIPAIKKAQKMDLA